MAPLLPVIRAALVLLMLAALTSPSGRAQTTRECGSRKASFDFSEMVQGSAYQSLSTRQQTEFEDHFCARVGQLETFFGPPGSDNPAGLGWWQPALHQPMRFLGLPDPYVALAGKLEGPYPNLRVLVSNAYTVSESLVPAALGHRGEMQFPYYEAPLRQSAIDHELTHVFFPNGNRLLAEGLAVYVQSLNKVDKAFPNYGVPLNTLVSNFVCTTLLGSLNGRSLVSQLDKVATPNPLFFHIGLKNDQLAADTYPIAGSFVQFLIEKYGWDRFHKLYTLTPLVPFDGDEGDGARWQHVYKVDLVDLENEWQSQFTGLKCPG